MGQQTKHLTDEADIGSGEKTPGQEDVERDEQSIPANPGKNETTGREANEGSAAEGRILQNGTHLARVLAVPKPKDLYEAQVYVRLAHEPESAETYIPAGTFSTEAEAWAAAEQRAQRAFREKEF